MFNWFIKLYVGLTLLLSKIRGGPVVVLLLGFVVGLLAIISFSTVLVYSSTEEFCSEGCHEMGQNVAEYKDSIHDKNRTGVRATCPNCHLPKQVIPLYVKKMGALHDLWGHFVSHSIDTPEKFELNRYGLAKKVWVYMKFNDSRECRSCHTREKMDPEKQSERAQTRHAKALRENLTCIDCHFGIAHKEPEGGPGPQEIKPEREWNFMSLI